MLGDLRTNVVQWIDILVTNELMMMLMKNYVSQYNAVKKLWNNIFRKCMNTEYSNLMSRIERKKIYNDS